MLFSGMELSERVKKSIRQQAAAEKRGRRLAIPRTWAAGLAALAVAVAIVVAAPLLQQPPQDTVVNEPPVNGGAAGTDVSSLTTTPLGTVEEAKAAFGRNLNVPGIVPEGYTLSEISATGMEGEPARDVMLTYTSGDKTITFVASRMEAGFPADMFEKTQVNGAEGFIFEQPELTELFWKADGIQYSITGPISGDEALKVAESGKQ